MNSRQFTEKKTQDKFEFTAHLELQGEHSADQLIINQTFLQPQNTGSQLLMKPHRHIYLNIVADQTRSMHQH